MQDVRVAAAQIAALPGKIAHNLERIEALLRKAARRGVQMICFPEMAVPGFEYGKKLRPIHDASEPVPDGPSSRRLMDWAREYDMVILAGLSERGEGGLCYNTCIIAGPGGYVGKYRKVHMNSERWLYCESSSFPVFQTPLACVGVNICYDVTFCEPARIVALRGAEVLFVPTCAGTLPAARVRGARPGSAVRRWRRANAMKWMQARANDNDMYAVYANMVGGPHRYVGGSCILDPQGDLIAQWDRLEEGMAVADLKASVLADARAAQTCTLKRRRPPIYAELVRT